MSLAFAIRCAFSYAALFGAGLCIVQTQAVWDQQSRSQLSPANAWMEMLRPHLVVVDAGHGGLDGGTQGHGVLEKKCSLEIARRVDERLRSFGLRTVMTRGTDTFVELEERSAIANRNKASLFVSIHLNADATSTDTAGVETYYSSRKRLGDLVKLRERFQVGPGQMVRDGRSEWLARSVQRSVCQATGANDRRARDSNYVVVMQSECPAILVECGYLTNEAESKKLRSENYQQKIAEAVALCVKNHLLASSLNPRRGIHFEATPKVALTGALRGSKP